LKNQLGFLNAARNRINPTELSYYNIIQRDSMNELERNGINRLGPGYRKMHYLAAIYEN